MKNKRQTWCHLLFCFTLASACNTDTTQTQSHQISNTQRTENKTTDVVIQQNSLKLLMMDILMSETCWVHKKWNQVRLLFFNYYILFSSVFTWWAVVIYVCRMWRSNLDCGAPIGQRQQRMTRLHVMIRVSALPHTTIFLSYRDINSASHLERSTVVSCRVLCCVQNKPLKTVKEQCPIRGLRP